MKKVESIDYSKLTANFSGRPFDDCVQTICKAVVDKMNEIVEVFNAAN